MRTIPTNADSRQHHASRSVRSTILTMQQRCSVASGCLFVLLSSTADNPASHTFWRPGPCFMMQSIRWTAFGLMTS